MSIPSPRPGMVRFTGAPAIYYMGFCTSCEIAIPFDTPLHRNTWAAGHSGGEKCVVSFGIDVIPDPGITAEKKNTLIARLREKYSNMVQPGLRYQNPCASPKCNQTIQPRQRVIQWDGKFWHAQCLDDNAYLRMASVNDLMPGLFNEAVKTASWLPDAYRPELGSPYTVVLSGGGGRADANSMPGGGGGGGAFRGSGLGQYHPAREVFAAANPSLRKPTSSMEEMLKLAEKFTRETALGSLGFDAELIAYDHGKKIGSIVTISPNIPKSKKPNARDRRRARRAHLQRTQR